MASVRIELDGKYKDVEAFLHWVENDKRLLRVDGLAINPDSRDPESLKIQITVLGLMGVEERPPARPTPRRRPPSPSLRSRRHVPKASPAGKKAKP